VALDILEILRLCTVDVAGEIEIPVVLLDLLHTNHAGVFRDLKLTSEGIDDLVNVLLTKAVLVAVFHEALGGVDHVDPLPL
jgi:hypothetical protein